MKAKLTFQLINPTQEDWDKYINMDHEIDRYAGEFNVIRKNRLNDPVKSQSTIEVDFQREQDLMNAALKVHSTLKEQGIDGVLVERKDEENPTIMKIMEVLEEA